MTTTGKLLSVPVGKALLGRAVDALGRPVDGKGPIDAKEFYPVEKIAPGIIVRKSVSQPAPDRHHGHRLDDPDRPRPARADHRRPRHRQDHHRHRHDHQPGEDQQGRASPPATRSSGPVYSIYVAVGQKNSNIVRTIAALEAAGRAGVHHHRRGARRRQPANQYIAPYAGAAMGEWFMENGMDALIVYDDLSKHAVAYRQISLILKRPSGREAYPGDVFYLHTPPPRARRPPGRQGLADRAADHRDPGRRRFGLHPDQRHLDHRRPDLPRDRPFQPGHPARRVGRPLRFAGRLRRADQGDQAGRRQAQGRARPVPRTGRVRAVRLRPRRQDQGPARPRLAHRRALQAAGVQSAPDRAAGRRPLGDAERTISMPST